MYRNLALAVAALISMPLPAETPWQVGLAGVGPVRIGMTAAQLSAAIHQPAAEPRDDDAGRCRYGEDATRDGLGYMMVDGIVARVDVDEPSGVTTISGIAVGDPVARVRATYGIALEEQPHFYAGLPNVYLTFWSRDRQSAVRFEVIDGRVARYYAGRKPEVEYVEGCE